MTSQKHFIVYRTVNQINGKFYIGQHITENSEDAYLGSGTRFKRALKKYGPENFIREVLFDFQTFEEMNEKEKELVTEDLVKDPMCYNTALGGTGSWWYVNKIQYSYSSLKEVVLAGIQKNKNDGINPGFTGRFHTEEWSLDHSKKMKILQAGRKNSQYGKVWIYSETLEKSCSVKKEEIQNFLDNGWKLGRRILKNTSVR